MKPWQELTPIGKVEAIKKVWQPGSSMSKMAEVLGTTRGAVSGVYNKRRMELRDCPLGKPGQYLPKSPPKAEPVMKAKPAPKPAEKPAEKRQPVPAPTSAPEPLFVSMLDLQPRQCRWAVTPDDAAPADHRFCGAETDPGKTYCPHHDARKWGQGTRAENIAFKKARGILA